MERRMKVGELARRTGLTVRTLHHYDQIGLLSPSGRTPAGHRLYDDEDVARLQHIASLKHLGLALDEIKACLARPENSLERSLELQLARIDERITRYERLRGLVRHLRNRLQASGGASIEELTRTIQVTSSQEKHYTAEQLEQLGRRARALGVERLADAEQDWADVFDRYRRAMREGLDPSSEEVKALAEKSAALIEEFTGGDPAIRKSLVELYRAERPERVLAAHGVDAGAELWEYIARSRAALDDERTSG